MVAHRRSRLAIGAVIKRAILLPDTLMASGAWVEQLCDDPQRFAERTMIPYVYFCSNAGFGSAISSRSRTPAYVIAFDKEPTFVNVGSCAISTEHTHQFAIDPAVSRDKHSGNRRTAAGHEALLR